MKVIGIGERVKSGLRSLITGKIPQLTWTTFLQIRTGIPDCWALVNKLFSPWPASIFLYKSEINDNCRRQTFTQTWDFYALFLMPGLES